jgi:hypothetical protein
LSSSIVDRRIIKPSTFVSDHDESSCDRRLSRCILNNSVCLDNDILNDSIQTSVQLLALYEKTIELAAKNKINADNAFHISLVERLPEILDIIAFDERTDCIDYEPNFVKVGSAIDTR